MEVVIWCSGFGCNWSMVMEWLGLCLNDLNEGIVHSMEMSVGRVNVDNLLIQLIFGDMNSY